MKSNGNGFGIASLVLGIISIVLSFLYGLIGIVCGILGIIFAIKQRKRYPDSISTAGLVTSIIGLVLSTIILLFLILVLGVVFSTLR